MVEVIKLDVDFPPEIAYPTSDSLKGVENPWNEQRKQATDKTTISVRFFRDFYDLLQTFKI